MSKLGKYLALNHVPRCLYPTQTYSARTRAFAPQLTMKAPSDTMLLTSIFLLKPKSIQVWLICITCEHLIMLRVILTSGTEMGLRNKLTNTVNATQLSCLISRTINRISNTSLIETESPFYSLYFFLLCLKCLYSQLWLCDLWALPSSNAWGLIYFFLHMIEDGGRREMSP